MSELERFGSCTLGDEGCTICGDSAVPVRVPELRGDDALVEDSLGQQAEVAVDFISGLRSGEVIFVHMGVAIARAEAL